MIVAWAFDLTPEGIKTAAEVQFGDTVTPAAGQKLNYAILGFIALAVGFLVADRFLLTPSASRGPADAMPAPDVLPAQFVAIRSTWAPRNP